MGWPQFMPSSIRHYAIDFDGDGHINLHQSVPDVIGSVANFLTKHGWQAGVPTHFRVQVPADPPSLAHLLAPDILPSFKPAEMQAYGAALDTPGQRHTGLLALVKLENAENSPSYVAGTENFYAITQYNHSSYYALAVIELAEAISGGDLFSVEK
jgi:membrane-bound lytic murein transglycosylase B